jgi:hypothetical protein
MTHQNRDVGINFLVLNVGYCQNLTKKYKTPYQRGNIVCRSEREYYYFP